MNETIITVKYHGGDAGPAVAEAIAAAKEAPKPAVLDFPTGIYRFHASSAQTEHYHISNTAGETEYPNGTGKKIGLLFKDIQDVTIRGNHSTMMFHDVMMPIVFDHAENITLRDMQFDFYRPVVSELTVTAVGEDYVEAEIQSDSFFHIEDGRFEWVGDTDEKGNPLDNWTAMGCAQTTIVQDYDPDIRLVSRTSDNPLADVVRAENMGSRKVRFYYDHEPVGRLRHTYQFRNDVRREQGAFIYRSKNITWETVSFYAMPGLGVVSQFSENLTFRKLSCAPRLDSGRTNVSMADFLQFSGCRGEITVARSEFWGAQDDAVNVHGTHLQVVGKPSDNQVQVRFMHHQSWGFDAFIADDCIEFISKKSLQMVGSAVVTQAVNVDGYNILLTLDRSVPEAVQPDAYVVENVTWTPNVTITDNYFGGIPTRGVLVTTRGKVLIENNFFDRMPGNGVLISDDANFWYESGMAKDVTIKNNVFHHTGNPVINILPEVPEGLVHSNIRVTGNVFDMDETSVIRVHGVNGFLFADNTVRKGGLRLDCTSSKHVYVAETAVVRENAAREIRVAQMDDQRVLPYGTAEEVKAETRRYMQTLGKQGGYILMASQGFEGDVPIENIEAVYSVPR